METKVIKISDVDVNSLPINLDSLVSSKINIVTPFGQNQLLVDNTDTVENNTVDNHYEIDFNIARNIQILNNSILNYEVVDFGIQSKSFIGTDSGYIKFDSAINFDRIDSIVTDLYNNYIGMTFNRTPNIGLYFDFSFDIQSSNNGEVKFWLTNDPYTLAQSGSSPIWGINYTGSYLAFPFSPKVTSSLNFEDTALPITYSNTVTSYAISSSMYPYMIGEGSTWGIIYSSSTDFTISNANFKLRKWEMGRYNTIINDNVNTNNDNYIVFEPPVSTNDLIFIQEYYNSDYNVLFNNFEDSVKSTHTYKIDYSDSTISSNLLPILNKDRSQLSSVKDDFYSCKRNSNIRYEGVKMTSAKYNVYTNGDKSYGKTAVIDVYPSSILTFKNVTKASGSNETRVTVIIDKLIVIPTDSDLKSVFDYKPQVYNIKNNVNYKMDIESLLYPSGSSHHIKMFNTGRLDKLNGACKFIATIDSLINTTPNYKYGTGVYIDTLETLNNIIPGDYSDKEAWGYIIPDNMSLSQKTNVAYVLEKLNLNQ